LTPFDACSTVRLVGSPITIGALSTNAPPGEARSARGYSARAHGEGLDDRALIDAVRAGNLHAFGTLYERHVAAVRGLARPLCGNAADADDVVADVFTNTLRAIKSGRGPRDDMRSYVLTSTRHTVIKLRTRRDSGRAIPTVEEQLDLPIVQEPLADHESGDDTIGAAFVQLPDRFRNVLWLSCVEGVPPGEVGRRTALSAGAASSLTLRARRALARSYLVSRISQPLVSGECAPIRDLLPSVIRDEAAPATVRRVDRHLATCCECREAFDEMESLASSLRSVPWLGAALAWLRSFAVRLAPESIGGVGGAAGLAPVVVTAMAVLTFAAGDTEAPDANRPVPPTSAPAQVASAPISPAPATVRPAVDVTPQARPIDEAPEPVTAPNVAALRESGVPAEPSKPPSVPPAQPVQLVDDTTAVVEVGADPLTQLVATVNPPLTATVDQTLDSVDQLGQEIASTSESLAGTTEQLLEGVDEAAVDVLEQAGADQVAATVEPVLDSTTELVTTEVVQPVTELVGDTATGTTTLVTATADDLLAGDPLGLTGRR
jgi:RNA polymerase sigma factor (sigma-70 family)